MNTPLDAQSIRNKIISLLARREYSRAELYQRLQSQAESLEILNEVLDRMSQDGYQSDRRFTESFIRQRISQYWGPKRIVFELSQKGIPKTMIDQVFDEMEPDWSELAVALAKKRFDTSKKLAPKEQAKQVRYLLNHGFSYDDVKNALRTEM
ncbi:MAG: regulatory protein RecX [Oceanospirillales bacterium]|jgi:regulatory protein|nr:MAG: regulatory protein RecX [Oceanospirillales bacterium]